MSSPADPTEARWARMEELFDAAVDLSPEARAPFLQDNCADDLQLLQEVEALITASETGGARVQQLIRDAAGKALASNATSSERIGPYTILSTIGQGGMGAVYLAERSDSEFQQRVAVKLLHKTMVTPELLQRFRSERQILADLNHPNIAHLIDGGTTDEGVPYIVMEYVEGKPINQYCDDNQLSIVERLDLFRQVCAAIEMAHQNLIVHRDIKPNNILVARDGTPKLLDFGIAKSLSPAGADPEDDLTRHGDRLLTPNHASPEQVAGRLVTTASDVYSLGVLLYELLCGVCPFSLNKFSPAQMEKIVTEVEPETPSRLLSPNAQTTMVPGRSVSREPQAVAMDRGTTVEKLRRQLDGDLDNIVLCALHKDRSRRYRSVSLLSEDLRRHLRGLPVTARPDSWRYRAGKFTQRNRFAVATGVLFVTAMAGFLVLTAMQAARLAERNASLTQANQTLTTTKSVLKGMLLASDPLEINGEEPLTLLQVLDRGAEKIATALDDAPLVRAELQETLGTVYYGQARNTEAAENLVSALEAREAIYGPDSAELVRNLLLLGNVEIDRENWENADTLLRRALTISRENYGELSEELAISQRRYADYLRNRGRWVQSEEFYRASIATYEALGPDFDRGKAGVLRGLGLLLRQRSEFVSSIEFFREALAVDRRTRGDAHPFVGLDLGNIAIGIQAQGKNMADAGPLYEEALAILKTAYDRYTPNHPLVVRATSNLARYYLGMRQYDEAEKYYAQAIAMQPASTDGTQNNWLAVSMNGLARVYAGQGRYEEAEDMYLQAIDIYEGSDDLNNLLASTLRNLGSAMMLQGRLAEAEIVLERSLAMISQIFDADHWENGSCKSELGLLYTKTGRYDRARVVLEDSVAILTNALGSEHRLTLRAKERLENLPIGAGDAAP